MMRSAPRVQCCSGHTNCTAHPLTKSVTRHHCAGTAPASPEKLARRCRLASSHYRYAECPAHSHVDRGWTPAPASHERPVRRCSQHNAGPMLCPRAECPRRSLAECDSTRRPAPREWPAECTFPAHAHARVCQCGLAGSLAVMCKTPQPVHGARTAVRMRGGSRLLAHESACVRWAEGNPLRAARCL